MPKLLVHDMEHIAVCTSCMCIRVYAAVYMYVYTVLCSLVLQICVLVPKLLSVSLQKR
jgi:hypothetical protein